MSILNLALNEEEIKQRDQKIEVLKQRYENYKDPWGLDIKQIQNTIKILYPFYLKYFSVKVHNCDKILKNESSIVVSNHTGQLPIDAALISMAYGLEANPPRILHAMIERFMAKLAFVGKWSQAQGQILGDRQNSKWLLENGESILVFPEGVRGISKNTNHHYEVQHFTEGFFRLAKDFNKKIQPIAVIGAEEMYPLVMHSKKVAKMLGLPALPISLNYFPLPSPVDIYILDPVSVSEVTGAKDIEEMIRAQVQEGLKHKRPAIGDNIKHSLKDFMNLMKWRKM